MSTTLIPVLFHGDQIHALVQGAAVWCVVKRLCQNLGLDESSQRKRLNRQPWATTAMMTAVADDGKEREMFCLHLRSLPMWLATIESSRVKPAIRRKLVLYQKEAAETLANRFLPGMEQVPRAQLIEARERAADLQAQIDDLRTDETRFVQQREGLLAQMESVMNRCEDVSGEAQMLHNEVGQMYRWLSGGQDPQFAPILRKVDRQMENLARERAGLPPLPEPKPRRPPILVAAPSPPVRHPSPPPDLPVYVAEIPPDLVRSPDAWRLAGVPTSQANFRPCMRRFGFHPAGVYYSRPGNRGFTFLWRRNECEALPGKLAALRPC